MVINVFEALSTVCIGVAAVGSTVVKVLTCSHKKHRFNSATAVAFRWSQNVRGLCKCTSKFPGLPAAACLITVLLKFVKCESVREPSVVYFLFLNGFRLSNVIAFFFSFFSL